MAVDKQCLLIDDLVRMQKETDIQQLTETSNDLENYNRSQLQIFLKRAKDNSLQQTNIDKFIESKHVIESMRLIASLY